MTGEYGVSVGGALRLRTKDRKLAEELARAAGGEVVRVEVCPARVEVVREKARAA